MIAWLRSLYDQWRIYNAVIDPNSKCPACGARNGKLKTVMVETEKKPNKTVMVEHTCGVCIATWYEPTVVKPEKWVAAKLLTANNPTQGL